MFFYVSDNSSFFWILFAFILLNFLLTIFMSGGKHRSPMPEPKEPEEYDYPPTEKSDRDLAEEFERVLGKKQKKIHTDNCELKHDRGKLYTESQFIAEDVAAVAKPLTLEKEAPKKKFAHPKLVQGLIMEQILEKPRSLKPYSEDF